MLSNFERNYFFLNNKEHKEFYHDLDIYTIVGAVISNKDIDPCGMA